MNQGILDEAFGGSFDAPAEDLVKKYELYDGQVQLYFDIEEHVYFRFDENGDRYDITGVTNAVHILDKPALVAWSAKMATEYFREHYDPCHMYSAEEFEVLLAGAKSAHRDIKDDAAEVGHVAHNWIEQYIKASIAGDEGLRKYFLANMPDDDRAVSGCEAALSWMQKHQVVWVDTERKVYSKLHNFAGTADGICRMSACGDPDCCGEWAFVEDGGTVIGGGLIPATFKDVLAVADWKTSNGLWGEYDYQTGLYTQAINEELSTQLGEEIQWRAICRLGKEDAEFETKLLPPETLADDIKIGLECITIHNTLEKRKADYRAFRAKVKLVKQITKAEKQEAERTAKVRAKEDKAAERLAAKLTAAAAKQEVKDAKTALRAAKATRKS